jgi:hypothetical protein
MAKKLNIKTISNLDASTNANLSVEGTEIDSETLLKLQESQHLVDDSVSIQADSANDVNVSTNKNVSIKNTKSKKAWLWALAIIGGIIIVFIQYFWK